MIQNSDIEIRFKSKLNNLVRFNITDRNLNNGQVFISLMFEDPSKISSSQVSCKIIIILIGPWLNLRQNYQRRWD